MSSNPGSNGYIPGKNGLRFEVLPDQNVPPCLRMMTEYVEEVHRKEIGGNASAALYNGWQRNRHGWSEKSVQISNEGDACIIACRDGNDLYGKARYAVVSLDIKPNGNSEPERFYIDVMVLNSGKTRFNRAISCALADDGIGQEGHVTLYRESLLLANRILDTLPMAINPKGL